MVMRISVTIFNLNNDYIQSEQEALVDFKSGIKDPNSRLSSWKGANYCFWQGITCENGTGFVISIDLHNPYPRKNIVENWSSMNLNGEIRASLGELKQLKYLDLSFNSFQAIHIPQFFGSLENLVYLNLSGAGFHGEVPSNLGNLSNLQYLDLSSYDFFRDKYVINLSSEEISLKYLGLDHSSLDFFLHVGYFNQLLIEDIGWLTSLVSLKYLSLDLVYLASVGSQLAKVLNRLPNLTELHLFECDLNGSFLFGLGELPNLQHLDLSRNFHLHGNISQLLSKSWRKLEFLNLRANGLHGSIPSTIGNLCNLKYLDLSFNDLDGSLPKRIQGHETCGGKSALPNLKKLYLLGTQLRGILPNWLGEVINLTVLSLPYNHLEGPIPNSLWTLQHLEYLDLQTNELNGLIPSSIGNLRNLIHLDLSENHLDGSLPEHIEGHETCGSKSALPNLMKLYFTDTQLRGKLPNWLGELRNLRELHLFYNQLEGPIPDSLGTLQHLEYLHLGGNELTGSLPKSIGQLSRLKIFDVSNNLLSGSLSEQHFWNLSKLEALFIGSNSFYLNVSPDWIPPFQLETLDMGSCHLGPSFPTWLHSQNNLRYLNLSNASISSPIPNWFWNFSFYLEDIDLSHNQIHGQIPNPLNFSHHNFSGPLLLYSLDLSSNQLTGTIPDSIRLLTSLRVIIFSSNQLTGTIPDSIGHLTYLRFIKFSRNNLTGSIPDSIGHLTSLEVIDFSMNNLIGSIPSFLNNCSKLVIIDLGKNNFSGEILNSFGQLQLLQSLHLNYNKLSGELPSSFQNLTSLEVLDVSYNKLFSEVPRWIGFASPNLVILNLRSNVFYGRLPSQLSNLSSLHVLDIAQNNLMGEIPLTLGELKAMAQENMTIYQLHKKRSTSLYEERLVVVMKGQSLEYTRTLSLVVGIDLSDNNISGGFPQGITKLFGLVALNLSRNHITGQIPENISMLRQLASLDLSSNELSGTIPSSMAALTFLSYLNLSENKLSGEIPFTGQMTTFDELAFVGNCDLCGPPLARKCRDEDSSRRQPEIDNKNDGTYVDQWLYLSIGLGFAAGILIPYFVLVIRKSWCEAYFDFVDRIVKWLLRGRIANAENHPRRWR